MKSTITKLWIVIILTSITLNINAQNRKIAKELIPEQINSYIGTYFPKNAVLKASFDNHPVYKKYKIALTDKVSLEFSPDYKIKEIKSKSKLPDEVIPVKILEYVKSNYPNNVITDWELDDGNQKIELDDGVEIEFTLKGQFIRAEN
ncbi:MAG: PepSY-like domain-containing protein [Gelidibacter sp.]